MRDIKILRIDFHHNKEIVEIYYTINGIHNARHISFMVWDELNKEKIDLDPFTLITAIEKF